MSFKIYNNKLRLYGEYYEIIPSLENFLTFDESNEYGWIYFISFGIDQIKIGKTKKIIKRISDHEDGASKYAKSMIHEIGILGPFLNYSLAEQEFLKILEKEKISPYSGEEWFTCSLNKVLELSSHISSPLLGIAIYRNFDEILYEYLNRIKQDREIHQKQDDDYSIYEKPLKEFFLKFKSICEDIEYLDENIFFDILQLYSKNNRFLKIISNRWKDDTKIFIDFQKLRR